MDCISYNPMSYDSIVLPYHILFKLCLSSDKTKLVCMSVIRLIILLILFNFLFNRGIIELDANKIPQTVFYILFAFYLFMNIIYIIVAMFKKPVMSKDKMDAITSELAKQLHDDKLSKVIT